MKNINSERAQSVILGFTLMVFIVSSLMYIHINYVIPEKVEDAEITSNQDFVEEVEKFQSSISNSIDKRTTQTVTLDNNRAYRSLISPRFQPISRVKSSRGAQITLAQNCSGNTGPPGRGPPGYNPGHVDGERGRGPPPTNNNTTSTVPSNNTAHQVRYPFEVTGPDLTKIEISYPNNSVDVTKTAANDAIYTAGIDTDVDDFFEVRLKNEITSVQSADGGNTLIINFNGVYSTNNNDYIVLSYGRLNYPDDPPGPGKGHGAEPEQYEVDIEIQNSGTTGGTIVDSVKTGDCSSYGFYHWRRNIIFDTDYAIFNNPTDYMYSYGMVLSAPNHAEQGSEEIVIRKDYPIVDGKNINLILNEGETSNYITGSGEIAIPPVSGERVYVLNRTSNNHVNLTLPTVLSESAWRNYLADEIPTHPDNTDNSGYIEKITYEDRNNAADYGACAWSDVATFDCAGDSPVNRVTLHFKEGHQYKFNVNQIENVG